MRSENIAESLEFIFMIWAIKTGNMVFLNTAKRKTFLSAQPVDGFSHLFLAST